MPGLNPGVKYRDLIPRLNPGVKYRDLIPRLNPRDPQSKVSKNALVLECQEQMRILCHSRTTLIYVVTRFIIL